MATLGRFIPPRYASAGLSNSSKKISIDGKCLKTALSKKCNKVVLWEDFVSTSYLFACKHRTHPKTQPHLINAANSESECTALISGVVHVVANKQDQLFNRVTWFKTFTLTYAK